MSLVNGRLSLPIWFGEVFNIGGGPDHTLSLWEAANLLQTKYGRTVPVTLEPDPRKADPCVYVGDIRKAEALLNWTPEIDLKEGIQRIASWVAENQSRLRA